MLWISAEYLRRLVHESRRRHRHLEAGVYVIHGERARRTSGFERCDRGRERLLGSGSGAD
jgi:hypothetical protein